MAYKINGTTVVDNSRNVCACCVTSCCITASSRMDAPSGTTAQRPSSPATGSIYFDTDLGSLVSYDGTAWAAVGGGAVDQSDVSLDSTCAWTIDWYDYCSYSNFFCKGMPSCRKTDFGPHPSIMHPGTVGCTHGRCDVLASFSGGSNTKYLAQVLDTSYASGADSVVQLTNCVSVPFGSTQLGCFYWGGFVGHRNNQSNSCFCSTECTMNFRVFQTGESELVHISRTCPFGATSRTCTAQTNNNSPGTIAETFFSRDNKASQKYKIQQTAQCPDGTPCCVMHFQAGLWPTYMTSLPHGPLPWIDRELKTHSRTSYGFCQKALFTVTSDTYGTNNPEVCCWAGVMTACKNETTLGTGTHSEFIPGAPCTRFNCISGVMSCWWQQLDFKVNPSSPVCFNCMGAFLCYFKHVNVISKRTDIVGGGNLDNREKFDELACTYTDGLNLKRAGHSCTVPFLLSKTTWTGTCQFLCCNFSDYFFSPNGCCLIAITTECSTSACACKVDYCSCGGGLCRKIAKVPVTTIIDRVNGCIKCFYVTCCIPLSDWEICIGCTRNCSACISNDAWLSLYCHMDSLVKPSGGRQGQSICAGNCCLTNRYLHVNDTAATNTYDSSFLAFNSNLTKSYGLCHKGTQQDIILVEFDHALGRVYKGRNIGSALKCSLETMAALSAPLSQCTQSSCKGRIAHLSACCTVQCTYASITASTGNCCVSILQKCLGYNLVNPNLASCICIWSPDHRFIDTTRPTDSVFVNPTNDHLVYFASVGCCCNCCYLAGWVGAICYDIENNCVSKVNTIWPPMEEIEKFFCTCYNHVGGGGTPTKSTWYPMKPCFYCMGCSNKCGFSHGISLNHYGNYQTYLESGCTDKGGFYLSKTGMKDFELCVFNRCNLNGNCCYFGCGSAATGRCVCGDQAGCVMNIGKSSTVQKVPYTTPLECVGWRSEPEFACILNSILAPVGSPNPVSDGGPGTTGFCARVCASCYNTSILAPCVEVFASQPCCNLLNWPCMAQTQLWGIKDSDQVCVSFCYPGCCCAGPYKMCDILKCTTGDTCVSGSFFSSTTTWQKRYQIYDNILPCHLDCCETSKRYVKRFMTNVETVKPVDFYKGGPFFRCYIQRTPGQNLHEGFVKLYHENILCCC